MFIFFLAPLVHQLALDSGGDLYSLHLASLIACGVHEFGLCDVFFAPSLRDVMPRHRSNVCASLCTIYAELAQQGNHGSNKMDKMNTKFHMSNFETHLNIRKFITDPVVLASLEATYDAFRESYDCCPAVTLRDVENSLLEFLLRSLSLVPCIYLSFSDHGSAKQTYALASLSQTAFERTLATPQK